MGAFVAADVWGSLCGQGIGNSYGWVRKGDAVLPGRTVLTQTEIVIELGSTVLSNPPELRIDVNTVLLEPGGVERLAVFEV